MIRYMLDVVSAVCSAGKKYTEGKNQLVCGTRNCEDEDLLFCSFTSSDEAGTRMRATTSATDFHPGRSAPLDRNNDRRRSRNFLQNRAHPRLVFHNPLSEGALRGWPKSGWEERNHAYISMLVPLPEWKLRIFVMDVHARGRKTKSEKFECQYLSLGLLQPPDDYCNYIT